MKTILVIGDFHIPSRASRIPDTISRFIDRNKFDLILCTGDFTKESTLRELGRIAPIKWVEGNMDFMKGPEAVKVKIEGIDVGLFHGTGIYPRGDPEKLCVIANRMGVKVIISGHTHRMFLGRYDDLILLNPGSVTGVWSGGAATMIPSFMTLKISGDELTVHCFELREGHLKRKVEKIGV